MLVRIELQRNRDYCGRLLVAGEKGRVIFGPVWCAGRANDKVAGWRGNDTRSCLLPYGDTPTGRYRLQKILSLRDTSDFIRRGFGRFGILSFVPIDGQGLLADSLGRFELWVHGGRRDTKGRLLNTNGSIRLADEDILALINVMKGKEGARAEIVEVNKAFAAPAVGIDDLFDGGDPPMLNHIPSAAVNNRPQFKTTRKTHGLSAIFLGEYDGGEEEQTIDYDFVSEQEGDQQLDAYTLNADKFPNSGVTVATGVDLGQMNEADLDRLGLSDDVKEKLQDYLGVQGQDAVDYLKDNPLNLTADEADELDRAVKDDATQKIETRFDDASDLTYADLPIEARTVIFDVSYQYGDLGDKTPNFWSAVTEGRWQDAVDELRDFGDKHPERRTAEADLLQQAIDSGKLPKEPGN